MPLSTVKMSQPPVICNFNGGGRELPPTSPPEAHRPPPKPPPFYKSDFLTLSIYICCVVG
ncbi:hypothetical protein L195_g030926 [Trifolium pratense]|uniref:Uncharacterized protein n=1 Tax=Trifolium pratense TaxID=57577 RepID=A0A2K3L8X9_TRIPR|nr:hypothetical protein L195_g030926 [Trifolium pratense]